jgi:hypothetical protein
LDRLLLGPFGDDFYLVCPFLKAPRFLGFSTLVWSLLAAENCFVVSLMFGTAYVHELAARNGREQVSSFLVAFFFFESNPSTQKFRA